MIPKIIHYCWFGRGEMPDEAKKCIASWHKYMPDYEYKMWNEDNFDVDAIPYTSEAYSAKKYAFVSDYVRLWALSSEGGLYFDTDVEVFKPFDDLLEYKAFAGLQGSKGYPVGTFVMASRANGEWVEEQRSFYLDRHFIKEDGSYDMTTNVEYMTRTMVENGFIQNGTEQDYKDLHICPIDYFCPNKSCPARHVEALIHFASRDAMNIDGLGDRIIEDFYNFGYIKNITDIYNLKVHAKDLTRLEGYGEKSITNLLEAIENSKHNSLERLIFGLGIPHVGTKTANILASNYHNLEYSKFYSSLVGEND